MVDNTKPTKWKDPFDRFDEAISDPRLYENDRYEQSFTLPYERPEAFPEGQPAYEPAPLFLSEYEEESRQQLSKYAFARGSQEFASGDLNKTRLPRIITGVVAVSAIGAILALFSIDSTRSAIFQASLGGSNATADFSAAQPAAQPPEAAAQPPQRIAAPPIAAEAPGPDVAAARRNPANALALASPSRDEITAAYQTAIKGKVALPEPAAREAAAPAVREAVPAPREAAPARRIDPDELAALLKRAKGLLAIGDITSARLLLERAADANEAEAALMLAGTYDPQVLGSQDMRSVTPDPEAAQLWYRKAAQLGSGDAQRRLSQLQR